MQFASAISQDQDPQAAVDTVLKEAGQQLTGSCDAAFLFVSSLYRVDWAKILRQIRKQLRNPLLIGCSGGGILGGNLELEFLPAISLVAAHLPRVERHPFRISLEDLEESRSPGFWIEKLGATPGQEPVGVLLPDPFTCDSMRLVQELNGAYPAMPLVGGLASGGEEPGENFLFFNEQIFQDGAVGVVFTGDIVLQTIVSQGCRPIGRPYIVTKAEGNVILELAGVSATEALQKLFAGLPDADKMLARRALFLGVVMNEQKDSFARGDFLIRNLIGIDTSTGSLAVGDQIAVGQTVQFQVRDANTSREDLQHLLAQQPEPLKNSPSAGALLFSCLGRGKDLYGQPHEDIRTIQAAIGNRPIAGFFCNGEIGPVGGVNFIHGFTSSLGLFRPRSG